MSRIEIARARDNTFPKRSDWWDNFIDSLPDKGNTTQDLWYQCRDEYLAAHGAELFYKNGTAYLQFDNEEDQTMFLLKYT